MSQRPVQPPVCSPLGRIPIPTCRNIWPRPLHRPPVFPESHAIPAGTNGTTGTVAKLLFEQRLRRLRPSQNGWDGTGTVGTTLRLTTTCFDHRSQPDRASPESGLPAGRSSDRAGAQVFELVPEVAENRAQGTPRPAGRNREI